MNKYVRSFLHRGLIFGGFGPIVMGIVFAILGVTVDGFSLGGNEVLLAVVSTYLLAFIQAGASVFNQIEHWPLAKCTACHFISVYLAHSITYVVNSWIPFEPTVLLIFTAVFAVSYLVIWLTVCLTLKATERRFNARLK